MNLHQYLLKTGKRAALATQLGVSKNYLWQIAVRYDGRQPSPILAKRIHEATGVPLATLRPDVWGKTGHG